MNVNAKKFHIHGIMCSVTGALAKGVRVGLCVPPCGNLLLWEEHCT